MPESTFIPKIEAACRKKEALFDTSKGQVRRPFHLCWGFPNI